MLTIDKLLEKYRKIAYSEKDKGSRFEELSKRFLTTYPPYLAKFEVVWLWNEFPFRKDFGGKDTGIDLVAKTVDGDYWAVQCKCYQKNARIDKPAVDSFLATSSKSFIDDMGRTTRFAHRLWISTTNNWNSEAEKAILNQEPPVSRIGLYDLQNAAVDWDELDKGVSGKEAVRKSRELLPHQKTALLKAKEYFKNHDRGKLIFACGTGKTFTSLKMAEQECGSHAFVLFLVPSIALLAQTLSEWSVFANNPINAICVCSDATASKGKGEDITEHVDLALPATTNVNEIIKRIRYYRDNSLKANLNKGLTVVFSTYQSIETIIDAQAKLLSEANSNEKDRFIFDMIICDEAHRTTGYAAKGEDASPFTKVHDGDLLKAKRRLYMTATPRLYGVDAKKKAVDKDIILWSMDDPTLYGEEIHQISFSEAVEKNLLSDYKVIVLTVPESDMTPALQAAVSDKNEEIKADDAAKLMGCINALSKRMTDISKQLAEVDPGVMHKAVAFSSNIKTSKHLELIFNGYKNLFYEALSPKNRAKTVNVEARHVDGSMSASEREEKLSWLKNADVSESVCRILTNVRCLSEGVDVPSLDAVLFLSSRKSKVDIVQAVGRVMRRAEGKKYGYVIIPVVVPICAKPEDTLSKSKDFDIVWDVLTALRAHDDNFNATINKIDLNKNKNDNGHILIGGNPPYDDDDGSLDTGGKVEGKNPQNEQIILHFGELQDAIYARMVEKVGSKRYWEQWAKDVALIADRHKARILELIRSNGEYKKAFKGFMKGLHANINPYIEQNEAVEMLAQHIITRPVFEALFENYSFAESNPVSRAMQSILELLDTDGMDKDREHLTQFYKSVQTRCKGVDNAEGKQKIVIELYDKFFKTALPTAVSKLGIVYTPVEVVDFILHSVDDVLKKEFNRSLSDKGVHILDPFTGTGTFMTRLLQSGILRKEDLMRKYTQELHANEIVLLAYYIASINIENAFHDIMNVDYVPFEGICLTDTFQLGENTKRTELFSEVFPKNSTRVIDQQNAPIRVIIGNPPYSAGQTSANDNAQNESYPRLERRIAETYAAGTKATNKNALYDSYIKAYRWASDRIDEKQGGVIGFVSNAGWLDGAAMDGMRKCLENEFSSIYVFNLRGNQRTQGEMSRREGGKIFGSGSRTPAAITILVKNPNAKNEKANIFYHDIGDYLTRDEKLSIVKNFGSCLNEKLPLTTLKPNEYGDWLNQRNGMFENLVPMTPDKKFNLTAKSFFVVNSRGFETGRDAWIYNFSYSEVSANAERMIGFYDKQRLSYANKKKKVDIEDFVDYDPKKISWTSSLLSRIKRGEEIIFSEKDISSGMYRPFCRQAMYVGKSIIHRVGQMYDFFPTGKEENLLICVSGIGGTKENSALITDKITDLNFLDAGTQCFPLYYYEKSNAVQKSLFDDPKDAYIRRDGVTDFILKQAKELYGSRVTKEDIFYYVYGFLHLPNYRKTFAADLKKSLPRLLLVDEPMIFWKLVKAGRELADIHLHYENQPTLDGIVVEGAEKGDFRVNKMSLKDDKSVLIYNDSITIKNIPSEAHKYIVNGRSPLDWIIDRYRITIDDKSGIENDPNKWCEEHENNRYILDLILSAITVSVRTTEIVAALPDVGFE
ncbi:MAG: DEAD/DEAH box helicase [Selenomonadaceae bacterium]|nr:DEAD/DEAH box helicase [Selenomonadaceae bacterium]